MKVTVAHSFSSFIFYIFPLLHQLLTPKNIFSSTHALFSAHKRSELMQVPSLQTCPSWSLSASHHLLITAQVVAFILKALYHPGALAVRFFPPTAARLWVCLFVPQREKKEH